VYNRTLSNFFENYLREYGRILENAMGKCVAMATRRANDFRALIAAVQFGSSPSGSCSAPPTSQLPSYPTTQLHTAAYFRGLILI